MSYKESELVLKISQNVDPSIWNEGFYQNFLDIIFKNRLYQKEATETALRYLNSGEYQSLEELAYENFTNNNIIKERWNQSFESMKSDLDLADKLAGTIDLATGTGKSYVMIAISLIMLASKKVDRVLVLVPSVTIERELTQKFSDILTNDQLIKSLGQDFVPPEIINGDSTIVENSIIIENRNAIYRSQESRNSIVDSLKNNGENTLVLNDEVHHVYYSESNEWKTFIKDEREKNINFKYVLGLTGTPYKSARRNNNSNQYFSDVIYRFSLRDAIEQNFVKDIEYISKEDIPSDKNERWQVILNSHDQIASHLEETLKEKPITVVVTSTQNRANSQAKNFKAFLKKQRNLTDDQVNEIVLCVHSGSSASVDRLKLRNVDNMGNSVEFIFSVSMLTEGWDVKRVFQIVPDEERAFNSKLLIAQVLGRGLRRPNGWRFEWGIPTVRVFNHEKWSSNVKSLVDEILELRKILTVTVNSLSKFNFELVNIAYKSESSSIETLKLGSYNLWENGIKLPTDSESGKSSITLNNIKSNHESNFTTTYKHQIFTIDEISDLLYRRFEDLDDTNLISEYQSIWDFDKIKKMLEKSLDESGNFLINELGDKEYIITKNLKNKILSSMNTIFRGGSKSVSYEVIPTEYFTISTTALHKETSDLSNFRNNKTLYFSDDFENSLSDDASKVSFSELKDTTLNYYSHHKITNKYCFKTPQYAVITSGNPEREFVKHLISNDVSAKIDSFVKSADMNFYQFDYTWRKGNHPKNGQFNPDWFIKQGDLIIVVETKDNSQISDPDNENIGKNKAAVKHFSLLNDYFEENNLSTRYKFTFLTPSDYHIFFQKLVNGEVQNFISSLDVTLSR